MLKREKSIILAARIVSLVFTPFYLPLLGLMALFGFSYLSLMPWPYKLQVLTLVYVFTILLPTVLIHLYRRYQGWNLIELGHKERRMVPYVISILCYFFCIYLMDLVHIPHFMSAILSVALFIQVVCALIHPPGVHPHFPVFQKARHPGGQAAGSASQQCQGSPLQGGHSDRRGDEPGLPTVHAGHGPAGAV